MPAVSRRPARWARRIVLALVVAASAIVPLAVSTSANATLSGLLVVPTDKGVVHGMKVGDVRQFRGIPYAAPPVGENRWRPPQPAAAWHGIREATEFGPHCAQNPSPFGVASTSEDCLFLNVYLPKFAIPGVPIAPVMVWIHGGALVVGQSDGYDPTSLTARGVVVVTINYRLGALGFLAHSAFAAESPQGAAGNYGLLDQQAAMGWVQRNIRHFGGNPRNVTIFGESAGGLSVHSQLASPLANGLFGRAIVESGAYALTQPSLTAAEATASTFATATGCPDQSAACLRALPVQAILARQGNASPTVDGYVLTSSVGDAFTNATFNKVPIMEGSNHDEWRLFVAQTEVATGVPLTEAGYIPAISRTLLLPTAAATALAARYPVANYSSPSIALSTLGTDAIFACNARKAVNALSQRVTVYQYEFNDPNAPMRFFPPVSFPTGAYHASEIQYLFDVASPVGSPGFTDDQKRLSRTMIHYWTNFAWFGNPNGLSTPFWPSYHADTKQSQSLVPGTSFTATNFADDHTCTLFGIPV